MDPSPFHARLGRLPRWGLAVALGVGVLAGILIPRIAVEAQATQTQTYTVLAGSDAAGNSALLTFAPNLLQVHRGDTVQWVITSFHNVHFEQEITPLVVAPEVHGKPLHSAMMAVLPGGSGILQPCLTSSDSRLAAGFVHPVED